MIVREADYDRPDTLAPAFAGVQKLLLISSTEVSGRLPQHRAVIEATQRAGVSLIAYTSMLHADTSSATLAIEHRQTEEVIADSGVPPSSCAMAGTPRTICWRFRRLWSTAPSSASRKTGVSRPQRGGTMPRPQPWC
ncbi:hypothetical protein [Mesorhizobium sp. LSHC420B00]|uniref:hypothetical protein n=1 Tax=Mesorhizobium sp. LSHC420B00 TaxID=1287292 RepID=UPI0003F6A418